MCVVCGCSGQHDSHEPLGGDNIAAGQNPSSAKQAVDAGLHTTGRATTHGAIGDLDYGGGIARASVPGMSQQRLIRIEENVLAENNRYAAANRSHFAAHGILALNLVSSPGSGKTTLLCATISALRTRQPGLSMAVIEGDQQTSHDAQRIRATGTEAIQINTGKGCHLDAKMVSEAFARLRLHGTDHGSNDHGPHERVGLRYGIAPPRASVRTAHGHDHERSILFIENVGNLVCPALWDLGEAVKIAILSVTEGEDKPLKYPDMFAAASVMVLNKIDLLPYVQFNVAQCIAYARRVNPSITVLQVSAQTGEGLDAWLDWLLPPHAMGMAGNTHDDPTLLRARIAELELRLREAGLSA